MDVREKLVELLQDANNPVWMWFPNNMAMLQLADYLIENGVTVEGVSVYYNNSDFWRDTMNREIDRMFQEER